MPIYECGDCGKQFRSKDALNTHAENCSSPTASDGADTPFNALKSRIPDVNVGLSRFHPRNIRKNMTLQNIGMLFGLLLMSTLFLGTASFMMTTSPQNVAGPTGAASAEETFPPTGQTIQSTDDIPDIPNSEIPNSPVVSSPLSEEMQQYLLVRGGQNVPRMSIQPAVLIQYNCDGDCPGLQENLTSIIEDYSGWVYAAPNPELDNRVVLTAYPGQMDQQDAFDRERTAAFICRSLQNQPLACIE